MFSSTIPSHPVPIVRSNPLYSELGDDSPLKQSTSSILTNQTCETTYSGSAIIEDTNQNEYKYQIHNPPKPERIADVSSLNRSNSLEITSYNNLLSYTTQKQIQAICKKVELYPQRYPDPNYISQSQILLLSPGWSSSQRYACCSMPSHVNPSGACRLHRFCPYCSYLTGRAAQLQFIPSFNLANWFFLTGSYVGSLECDSYNWLNYWNAYKAGLDQLLLLDKIRGYYLTEELAVTKLVEVQVLPHIHAIIDSDEFDAETQDSLTQTVQTHLTAVSYTHLTLPTIYSV